MNLEKKKEKKIISAWKFNTHLSMTGRLLDYREYLKSIDVYISSFSTKNAILFRKFLFRYVENRIKNRCSDYLCEEVSVISLRVVGYPSSIVRSYAVQFDVDVLQATVRLLFRHCWKCHSIIL